jgi:hypothetical protein
MQGWLPLGIGGDAWDVLFNRCASGRLSAAGSRLAAKRLVRGSIQHSRHVLTIGYIPTAMCWLQQAKERQETQHFRWSASVWSPRRNRTGDPIVTMNLAPTAVRTSVCAGRGNP